MNEGLVLPLAFAIAFAVTSLSTPLTGRLALHLGIIDHPSQDPDGHKQHAAPTPYLGGIALFLGLAAGSGMMFFAAEGIPIRHFVMTIGAGLAIGLVGLADDVKPLPRSLRIVAQAIAAMAAWGAGFGVSSAAYDWLDLLLTIVWIVGITNAFNLLDNMDGVSAGLAGIATLSFAAMAAINDLPVLPTVAIALAGASLGFLVHNRHPARVFMGDAGSLFLGFLVALLGIRLRFNNLPEVTFMVPVVVLGLPILDTTLVVVTRLRDGRPLFLGARDHIAHRLVLAGLSIRAAVWTMYVTAAALAWLGLVISRSSSEVGFMLLGFVFAMGLMLAAILWKVPINDSVSSTDTLKEAGDIAPTSLPEASDVVSGSLEVTSDT